MNKGINLLKAKQYRFNVPSDRLGRLRVLAIGSLFIVSVTSIIILILIVLSPLPQLKRQEQDAKSLLSRSHKDIAKFLFVNKRADTIGDIFLKQKNYSKTIEALQANIPNGVEIVEFKITKDNLSFTFSSKSLKLTDLLINNVTKLVQERKEYSKVILKDFSTEDENRGFLLTLLLTNL